MTRKIISEPRLALGILGMLLVLSSAIAMTAESNNDVYSPMFLQRYTQNAEQLGLLSQSNANAWTDNSIAVSSVKTDNNIPYGITLDDVTFTTWTSSCKSSSMASCTIYGSCCN